MEKRSSILARGLTGTVVYLNEYKDGTKYGLILPDKEDSNSEVSFNDRGVIEPGGIDALREGHRVTFDLLSRQNRLTAIGVCIGMLHV